MTDYRKSEKTISAFLQNTKITDIAKAAGLSRSTIYRLKDDDAFQDVLKARRQEMVQAATDKMRMNFMRDVEILQELAEDTETPSGTRAYCCQILMNQLSAWTQNVDFEMRLSSLEKAKNNDFRQF